MAVPSSSVSSVASPRLSRAPESLILSPLPARRVLSLAVRSSSVSLLSDSRVRFENAAPRFVVACSRESKGYAAAAVTKDSWEKSVLKSKVPVLVEFYASWCGPCKMIHRVIDEIAQEYAGKVECFAVNADTETEVADEYDIKAVPVVLLFKNGEKRDTVVGTMPKDFYVAAIERVLKV